MRKLAAQRRHRHQVILYRHAEICEYWVAASLRRFVDRGHAITYCVARLVVRCGCDEMPNSTAHGGTVVNNKESGPGLAGPRRGKLLRCAPKNNSTEIRVFPMESDPGRVRG
jgi:hypothetical protein